MCVYVFAIYSSLLYDTLINSFAVVVVVVAVQIQPENGWQVGNKVSFYFPNTVESFYNQNSIQLDSTFHLENKDGSEIDDTKQSYAIVNCFPIMAWEYITAAFGSHIISGDNKSDTYKMYLKIIHSDMNDEAKKEV